MNLLLVIFLATGLISCGKNSTYSNSVSVDSDSGIIGGQSVVAEDQRFNSAVAIRMSNPLSGAKGLCTGTLIRKDIILTAAHCIKNEKKYSHFEVQFSKDIDAKSTLPKIYATKYLVHRQYNPEVVREAYDIALLQFSESLPQGFQPAPLLLESHHLRSGDQLIVAGYGIISRFFSSGPGILRSASVVLANAEASPIDFRINQWIRGICAGDSGGPAYVEVNGQWHVAGVANKALSIGPVHCIISSYFIRVDRMNQWIQDGLKLLKTDERLL